jgi:acyl dehydratase
MIELDPKTLAGRTGEEVAVSDWMEISQARIDRFADVTDDHQWIHVDPARAAESPFRTTVAHGFLTLSLVPALLGATLRLPAQLTLNYGSNRVRFVSPLPAGSRVRGRFTVMQVRDVPDALQVTWGVVIEREGGTKPCCVAEWIVRYYPSAVPSP